MLKVEVSFIDGGGALQTVTSLPFGPIVGSAPLRKSTLVSNTDQSHSATAEITGRYDMGFKLGGHSRATRSPACLSIWPRRRPI